MWMITPLRAITLWYAIIVSCKSNTRTFWCKTTLGTNIMFGCLKQVSHRQAFFFLFFFFYPFYCPLSAWLFDLPGLFQRSKVFVIWNTTLRYSHSTSGHLDSYLRDQKLFSTWFRLLKNIFKNIFVLSTPKI